MDVIWIGVEGQSFCVRASVIFFTTSKPSVMFRRSAWVEEVQEVVVGNVDEELRATGIGLAGVCHRQRPWGVRDFCGELIRNVAAAFAHNFFAINLEAGPIRWATSASAWAPWVLRKGAAELRHEIWNHTVEVEAIVVSVV